ncbi:MAG: hypothetical protein Q4C66_00170 [Lachnospiraceae bacterium]|nr:hypothetical protein [Lachnospiraceae bacterium]
MNETTTNNPWNCPKNGCPVILSIATSIAHEEDALACILNAECAKINKVLQSCSNIDDLIAIDTSVQATLDQINDLEGTLKAKLDAILPLLEDCM